MTMILKLILVASGLKFRTIKNRIGWKTKMVKPISSTVGPITELSEGIHEKVFIKYLSRSRQVLLGTDGTVSVLDRLFDPADFFLNHSIDKNDYLYVYTFFYLDFDISALKSEYLSKIISSDISKEPFVLSQQIFNLISNYSVVKNLGLHDFIYRQYTLLCQCIEYKVDGNHVIENMMSICLYEAYFFDSSSNLEMLDKELSRQTDQDGHVERNTKYSFDILVKLLVIIELLETKGIKHRLYVYIERLRKSLQVYYNASFYSHDNIGGDTTFRELTSFFGKGPDWTPVKLINVRSMNGMSGHSFDCSYFAPLPSFIRCFGTYQYANTSKRSFQRKRINNSQPCLRVSDQSIWFWKSFRILFKLPSMSIKIKATRFVVELVFSQSRLRVLFYKWKPIKNGWTYQSPYEFMYKVYVDEVPQVALSEIKLKDFKMIFPKGSTVCVKSTVRACALGVLTKTYSVLIKSKSITLVKQ
jgi:hypothetical protein